MKSAASRCSQLLFLSLWPPRPTRLLCRSNGHVDQGGGTSRDDGRVPSAAAGAIPPIIRTGAIRPITIPASLTAGGDYGRW
jgi:hypothetical protein